MKYAHDCCKFPFRFLLLVCHMSESNPPESSNPASNQKRTRVFLDDKEYSYNNCSKDGKTLYYACANKKKTKCKATCVVIGDTVKHGQNKIHSPECLDIRTFDLPDFSERMKERALMLANTTWRSVSSIRKLQQKGYKRMWCTPANCKIH